MIQRRAQTVSGDDWNYLAEQQEELGALCESYDAVIIVITDTVYTSHAQLSLAHS